MALAQVPPLRNGDGTFHTPVDSAAHLTSQTADVNNDGRSDILFNYVIRSFFTERFALGWAISNGDGTFGATQRSSDSYGALHLLNAADFDRNGTQDVIAADGVLLLLFLNTGGSFSPALQFTAPSRVDGLAVGDFNRDGAPDVAVVTAITSSITIMLNTTAPTTGCTPSTTDRTVTICSPLTGSTVSSPVHIVASTTDKTHAVTGMKIYLDGNSTAVYSTTSSSIDTNLSMGAGSHRITVKAWDSAGSFSSSVSFTVGSNTSTCTASTTDRTVTVCSPLNGSTVGSPVHVVAKTTDLSHTVTGMKIYLDGNSTAIFSTTANSIDTNLSMAAGSHHITVKAWDSLGSFSSSVSFTVQ